MKLSQQFQYQPFSIKLVMELFIARPSLICCLLALYPNIVDTLTTESCLFAYTILLYTFPKALLHTDKACLS